MRVERSSNFDQKDVVGAIEDAKTKNSLLPHLTQIWQLFEALYYQDSNLLMHVEGWGRLDV